MKRPLLIVLVALLTGTATAGGEPPTTPELDRYGGWKDKQFEATGFFRTEHDGERWWLVTPDGNAFLSLGINHYHPGWWTQDYNRDHWVKEFGAERSWDQAWKKGFRDRAVADCRRFGFNTLGFHSEMEEAIQDLSARLYQIATYRGTTYYIDSRNGSDEQAGLSPQTAWRSLARVNGHTSRKVIR